MGAPNTIPNLDAWWKADSLALAEGATVSSWADSGPGGFTATQGTAAAQPTFRTGQINGLPVVRFDGVDDVLLSNASTSHTETTIFSVIKPTSTVGDRSIRVASGSGGITSTIRDGKPRMGSQDLVSLHTSTTTVSTTAFQVLACSYSDSTNTVAFHRNGTADGSSTAVTASPTAGRTTRIGAEPAGGYLVGDIAELIVYSRVLTSSERAEVHSYLQDKYAIAVADYVASGVSGAGGIASGEGFGRPSVSQPGLPQVKGVVADEGVDTSPATVTLPEGTTTGDTILVIAGEEFATTAAEVPDPNNGPWTLHHTSPLPGASRPIAKVWSRTGLTAGTAITITPPSPDSIHMVVFVIGQTNGVDAVTSSDNAADDTLHTAPAATATFPNSLYIGFWLANAGSAYTGLSSDMLERAKITIASDNAMIAGTKFVGAGAASSSATYPTSPVDNVAVSILVRPASQLLTPPGIVTGEAFGTAVLNPGPVSVTPTGIPSAEAWGAAHLQHVINTVGIASAEAFGSAALSLAVTPTGIPSGEAFGATALQYLQQLTPTSIPSGEAFGDPTITITVALATPAGTRRRRAVPVYELLMMGRLPRQSGPPTFLLADPIEWSTLSWTTTLSKPQSLSVSCSIANLTDPVKQRLQAPHLLPTELWLQRNGKTVFAGPLLGGTEDSDQLNLEAGGLLTYLQWMFVETDLRFDQTDQVTIARTLVDRWQATEYGHFGINTADVGASGVLRDVVYERSEIHQVSRRIEEMGTAALGFDAEVDPGSRNLQLWSPIQGVDRSTGPDAVVFDGRSIEGLGGMFSISPNDLASDAIGTGTAPGGDGTFWSQQADLDLRAVFGRTGIASSFSDVPNQSALDDFVKGLRDARGEPLRAPGRQVRVTPDTDLNSYDVGDTISYQLSGVLGIGGAYRIRSRRVSVQQSGQETVSLEFV